MAAPSSQISRCSSRASILLAGLIAACVAVLATAAGAPADELEERLDEKQAALEVAQDKQSLLTSEVTRFNDQIDRLTGEVAALRNREAAVQVELDEAEAQLEEDQRILRIQRERLARSVDVLEDHLVDIYKADEPDAVSIVLEADGLDDALGRFEYLQRIQEQNSVVVGRVRELRDETVATVERVKANRDAIVAKRDELASTRGELEARQAQLDAARSRSERELGWVEGHVEKLEAGASKIEDKIQKQLAAAAAADSGVAALPAGPIQGGSSGMIWPVSGPIVSPFGPRWGTLHAGIDIAVPAGTPIRAAQAGTIAFAQSDAESGGYGNYTCVDHGGGLATCYAHQSSFAITSGPVAQGDVIGYVGCTGHCFGDHLHFEVRVGGAPVDPMGYL